MRGFINQVIVYLIEITLFISVMFCIYSLSSGKSLFDWTNHINTYDFVEKSTVFLVFYQIIVYSVLGLFDSSRKDAILAKIRLLKLGIVKVEADRLFTELKDKRAKFNNDKSFMVNKVDKNEVNKLYDLYDQYLSKKVSKSDTIYYLKYQLTCLEHEYNRLDLTWRLSFLLRLLKNW